MSPEAIIETMQRAHELAARGRGYVEPNPMVGAVVLDSAGRIVGEGWHEQFGGSHAEVPALRQAGEQACGGTLVVTLEPCCHRGKTPPCTEAVLASGIRRVVVAMPDPFPAVAGKGLQILRDAGLSVECGWLEAEARALNAPYLKLVETGRPWVIAKWAMSLDGRIATRTGDSKWISNPSSRAKVHELRGRVDAIVVGRGTLVADDPLLTARPAGARVATRVVVSASGDLPQSCQLLNTISDAPVLIATTTTGTEKLIPWKSAGAEVVAFEGPILPALLAEFGRRRFTNVLLEGGSGILGSACDAGLMDEAHVYVAPILIGGTGALAPVGGLGTQRMANALRFGETEVETIDGDIWIRAKRTI